VFFSSVVARPGGAAGCMCPQSCLGLMCSLRPSYTRLLLSHHGRQYRRRSGRFAKERKSVHNKNMSYSANHPLPHENHRTRWQQVQLLREHRRHEETLGVIRSASWRESVTITWTPTPASKPRPTSLQRTLATAVEMIAPWLADIALVNVRRFVEGQHNTHAVRGVAGRRLPPSPKGLPHAGRPITDRPSH
jgi:hypothetical protein